MGGNLNNALYPLIEVLGMGHLPFNWSPPNGYPDSRGYWTGYYLPRWNFGARIAQVDDAVFAIDTSIFGPNLRSNVLVRRIDAVLANGCLSPNTRSQLRAHAGPRGRSEGRTREVLGLALASPDFQEY